MSQTKTQFVVFLCALCAQAADAAERVPPETAPWLEIHAPPIIEPGTALDFSAFRPSGNVPAGTWGRVIVVGEHFEFEKLPGIEQRFYGMNTTGSMNTPEYDDAVRFAGNAARLGYNAIRIHHHDDEITEHEDDEGTNTVEVAGDYDGTTLDPTPCASSTALSPPASTRASTSQRTSTSRAGTYRGAFLESTGTGTPAGS